MDDPVRRAEHQARLGQRCAALQADFERILPLNARFVWEIGSGHGHFLTAFAQAHPAELCIGIDIAGDRVDRARLKQRRAGLTNLHFLRAEAAMFLDLLRPDARPSAVFVLFPDPWPKKRHHKHRLLQPGFLGGLARRVESGTRLYFRTDYAPYAEEAAALLDAESDWKVVREPWPFEFETVFQARAPGFHSLIGARR